MKIVWTDSARRDLGDIVTYIWFENPSAAKKIRHNIEKTAKYLRSQPFMGRTGELPGKREAFVRPSYRTVYRIGEDQVWILRVVHSARQWPPADDEIS